MNTPLQPLHMWAGGKTKLIKHYKKLWPNMANYDNYVEPLFGGGAVFCWLQNTEKTIPHNTT